MNLTASSLKRRTKRQFNRSMQGLFIPCAPGLEPVVYAEVASILGKDVDFSAFEVVPGGVQLTAHIHAIYRLNLWLRTGNRVLLRLGYFWADSLPSFFGHARRLPWEVFLGFHGLVHVRASSSRSRLATGKALQESLVDAINARFSTLRKPAASVDEPRSDIPTVFIRIVEDHAMLSLDTTGSHLYKRGYRVDSGPAPMRPTLASAMLRFSGWRGETPLVDPFCGSGTIVIEAATLGSGRAPGELRRFAFEHLPFHNPSLWTRLREEAQRQPTTDVHIFGSDIAAETVHAARLNAQRARQQDRITLTTRDAFALSTEDAQLRGKRGTIVTNLPYGRRVTAGPAPKSFVRSVLRHLGETFPGWQIVFATPRRERWRGLLNEASTLTTSNGGIPIQIVRGRLG